MPSAAGAVIESIGDQRWRVYELPPLGPAPSTPATAPHAAAAGRIVGRVHRLGIQAAQPMARWLTSARTEDQWHALQAAAVAADAPWADRLAEAIPAIVDVTGVVEPEPVEGLV